MHSVGRQSCPGPPSYRLTPHMLLLWVLSAMPIASNPSGLTRCCLLWACGLLDVQAELMFRLLLVYWPRGLVSDTARASTVPSTAVVLVVALVASTTEPVKGEHAAVYASSDLLTLLWMSGISTARVADGIEVGHRPQYSVL